MFAGYISLNDCFELCHSYSKKIPEKSRNYKCGCTIHSEKGALYILTHAVTVPDEK